MNISTTPYNVEQSTKEFSWKDLAPAIKKKAAGDATIYILIQNKWVRVGGYEIKLLRETTHGGIPIVKIAIKQPPTDPLYWFKNFFAFLQKGIWVYNLHQIPFTSMLMNKHRSEFGASDGPLLVAFKKSRGPSVSTGD